MRKLLSRIQISNSGGIVAVVVVVIAIRQYSVFYKDRHLCLISDKSTEKEALVYNGTQHVHYNITI